MAEFDNQRRVPSRADNLRLTRMPPRPPRPGASGVPVLPVPTPVPPPPAPEPARKRRGRGWLVGLLVVGLAAGGAVAYRSKSDASVTPTPTATTLAPPSPTETAEPAEATETTEAAQAPSKAPAASKSPTGKANPSGTNLALAGTCTASGVEGDPWLPKYACDGDPATRWSSAFTDKQWLRADLKRRWKLTTITLSWERSYAVRYRVETSLDGKTWTKLYGTADGTGGTVEIPAKNRVARYVRVFGLQRLSAYGYSLLEFQVR
ncbi:discoidin domain-containing protein [Actinoplanes awajinensis]|uniref:F5/8 type C domain-containing protein n=1 Tax=Actinoplanes awajinensis subsp. mycoplanecinus TaxID=135947 RepID=A0A101JQ62_9ACTN|nr:discoidin domain-containing protein [Actinoplanes awajinensis]KUL30934.1 hypothetical protein ADL15_23575 [Actinoplanes awajinensis subsp. mycoplanecinus]